MNLTAEKVDLTHTHTHTWHRFVPAVCIHLFFVHLPLFHRPTHWMGGRIYFRGGAVLYQVSSTPSLHQTHSLQPQNPRTTSKHALCHHEALAVTRNHLFPSNSAQTEELLFQTLAAENTLCFRRKYYMAVNLEPLLPISVR